MQLPDIINGCFEAFGGVCIWLNVKAILRDRQIKGVQWHVTAFFFAWGIWNLWYYPSLHQWMSFVGGLLIVAGNCAWLVLALRLSFGRASFQTETESLYGLTPQRTKAVRMIVSTSDGQQFYTVPVTGWTTFLFSTLNRVNRLGLRIAYLKSGFGG